MAPGVVTRPRPWVLFGEKHNSGEDLGEALSVGKVCGLISGYYLLNFTRVLSLSEWRRFCG